MPKDTKRKQKAAAILCAAVALALLLIYLATMAYPLLYAQMGDVLALIVTGVGVLTLLAVMAGVVLALIQRLREIDNGEEEDARKY